MVGPVFTREVFSAPRGMRLYIARASYALALLILLSTAWMVLTGTQVVRNLGDLARFGSTALQLLAPLQLAVTLFFAALSAAGAVALEKDRRTLELLLLTRLSNWSLVVGRLLASLLSVFTLLLAVLPLFMLAALLGGVSFAQIGRTFAVAAAGAVAAGSLGSTLALWREKTFQTLAMTVLVLVLWLGAGEVIASGALGAAWRGIDCQTWAAALSPWRATVEAMRPALEADGEATPLGRADTAFLAFAAALVVALNGLSIVMLRVWNPTREAGVTPHETPDDEEAQLPRSSSAVRPLRTRQVWDNPILWREVRTWAYGRRMLMIRVAYLAIFLACAAAIHTVATSDARLTLARAATPLAPLFILSLVLVNAQAVTSITSERDARALDLLLVTDLTPREFVYGKLAGILYNTKEIILLPPALCVYLWNAQQLPVENLLYLVVGWFVVAAFVAMLGVHCGLNYANSRTAIGVSLATVFFLFVGVVTCMRILVAFSGSINFQLAPFLACTIGGGIGLVVALGWRNESPAIWIASFTLPIAMFYAITSFLLGYSLAVFLVVVSAYGFAIRTLLIPAIDEFDVATAGKGTERE